MDRDLVLAKQKLDEETITAYEQLEAQFVEALQNIQAVLIALGRRTTPEIKLKPSPPRPIVEEIREYLRELGRPAYQSEIISAVGERRRKRYRALLRPFGDIWKSLQYHDKHDEEIVCVELADDRLKRGTLQQRPKKRSALGGKQDTAEYYSDDPQNLFWFRDDIKTYRSK